MSRFRPQRQFGQWLLRALGAQDSLTGRTIAQLEWDALVNPTFGVHSDRLPGLVGTPMREVWMAGGIIDAVVGESPFFKLWAAPNTLETQDPRVAAGLFVLGWELRPVGGDTFANDHALIEVTILPEVDPGPNLAAGTININALGGSEFPGTAAEYQNVGLMRSPRAQCNIDTVAVPSGLAVRWPSQTNTLAPRGAPILPAPMYVPPGRAFLMGNDTPNTELTFAITWVEAEERPVPPVPATS